MRTVTIAIHEVKPGDQLIRGIYGLPQVARNKVENIVKLQGLGELWHGVAKYLLIINGKFYVANSIETVQVQIDTNCR